MFRKLAANLGKQFQLSENPLQTSRSFFKSQKPCRKSRETISTLRKLAANLALKLKINQDLSTTEPFAIPTVQKAVSQGRLFRYKIGVKNTKRVFSLGKTPLPIGKS
jgi:hypothetical protein